MMLVQTWQQTLQALQLQQVLQQQGESSLAQKLLHLSLPEIHSSPQAIFRSPVILVKGSSWHGLDTMLLLLLSSVLLSSPASLALAQRWQCL